MLTAVVLKASDLAENIQAKVLELAQEGKKTYKIEREIAAYLKKELDLLYGASWHVVVGKSFGLYVTHEQGYFAYFYVDDLAFLVFKSL
ncbi:hypothetical protein METBISCDRAFT_14110 [Metschnikowia bicuspidata]|uniref:Dynein light chain n=1 Tax=Metschnikowia bicuspidata TaxID=27322 RepID=A0A4P9ZF13_9ASCO|nr:hypothetical protein METBISCDRAFT_14110 [Metschnikowia bicuspidata]